MNITQSRNGTALTVAMEGKLNTTSSQQLEEELKRGMDGVTELVLDLEKVDYITSAGLRVLVSTQKIMNRQGSMRVIHINPEIMKILNMTGIANLLTIE